MSNNEQTPQVSVKIYWAEVLSITKVDGLEDKLTHRQFTELTQYLETFTPGRLNDVETHVRMLATSYRDVVSAMDSYFTKALRKDFKEYMKVDIRVHETDPGLVFFSHLPQGKVTLTSSTW
jgi:predicted protein tyrosine phosphatase